MCVGEKDAYAGYGHNAQLLPSTLLATGETTDNSCLHGRSAQHASRSHSPALPGCAMLTYLTAYPSDTNDALFLYHFGRLLTRQELTEELRQLLPLMGTSHTRDYAGHSFRIGTATTAAMASTTDWLIRAMGRWRRNSVLRYTRTTDTDIAQLTQKLSEVQAHCRTQ